MTAVAGPAHVFTIHAPPQPSPAKAGEGEQRVAMPEPTPEAWAQIRHAYEHTDQPLAHICDEHAITIPMLRYRMKKWDWTRRKPLIPREGPPPVAVEQDEMASSPGEAQRNPGAADKFAPDFAALHPGYKGQVSPCSEIDPGSSPDPVAIVPRLQSAVVRVLPAIEATIARLATGAQHPREMEQAGRALGALTRTLRELNALLAEHNARPGVAHPVDDYYDMPQDLDAYREELARRIETFLASRGDDAFE